MVERGDDAHIWEGAFTNWFATSSYRGNCPHCGQWVSKRPGDKHTKCYRCGWNEGLPLLRGITHHPNWFRWRRWLKRWTKRTVAIAFLIVALSAVVGTGFAPLDALTQEQAAKVTGSQGPLISYLDTGQNSSSLAPENRSEINETNLEILIHNRINDIRENHSLRRLDHDTRLHEIAKYHSVDMAENDYYAHTSPSGESMSDRYDKFDYSCKVPAGGNQYYSGAENIHRIPYQTSVSDDGGTEYYDTMGELADAFVEDWMQSKGHRENILQPGWDDEGIGVVVTERNGETWVYATQNFC